MRVHLAALAAVALLGLAPGRSEAQSTFIPLGDLPGGRFQSEATSVSGDGSVVVGYGTVDTSMRAFRWEAGQMVQLPSLTRPGGPPSLSTTARAVSEDGTAVIGFNIIMGPLYWKNGSVMEVPELTEQHKGSIWGISADGSVLAGVSARPLEPGIAYRWELSEQDTRIDALSAASNTAPLVGTGRAVSRDGNVIVGVTSSSEGYQEAFRWTAATGAVRLGTLPGGPRSSFARAISSDGKVIVGSATDANDRGVAFRWAEGVMTGLGSLPGAFNNSTAQGVCGDGSVVVGSSLDNEGFSQEAFLWRNDLGLVNLREFARALGTTGLDDWKLSAAYAISRDGNAIVGYGNDTSGYRQAYLLRADNPGGFKSVLPPARTASVKVTLQGMASSATPRPVTFEFRPSWGGNPITLTANVGPGTTPEQRVTLQVPQGNYQLAVKSGFYLQQVASVSLLPGGPGTADVTLPVGDINGDNQINLTDLVQFRANYGKTGANLAGDLDGDGTVNLTDLVLLRDNYGKKGAP